jgi:hypothetical protein
MYFEKDIDLGDAFIVKRPVLQDRWVNYDSPYLEIVTKIEFQLTGKLK